MLTLFCLGDLRLERGGATVLAGRRKPLALLAYLARRGQRPSSREELASLLWGTGDDASARKSLRQCLSDLRAAGGIDFTESDAGVMMTPGTIVTDADLFESDVRAARWRDAVDRWAGEFITAGESLGDEAWQSWLDGERASLRRQLSMACEQLAAAAAQRGEWHEVTRAAERWRSLLPDDGHAWSREIHALQASGRLADAISRVTQAEHHFRNELRVAVPDDVARLGRVLSRVGHVAGTAAASLLTPDLVGRGETLATMARALHQLVTHQTEGSSLLLAAGEGLGKTRILREFARQARDGDPSVTVIEAAALPSDRARSFSLVQDVITRLAPHHALAACSPETLSTLAHVAPAIREHFHHLPAIEPPHPDAIAAAFYRALVEVARASPVVVILDDLPEGDVESLGVLTPLVSKPPGRTLMVAAGRPESWQESESLTGVLNRADAAHRLTLECLRVDETRTMLSSMAPLSPATLDTLVTSLHDLGGGVPGLQASLMMHLAATGALARGEHGEWSLGVGVPVGAFPADVEDRWRARYGKMAADTQRVVDAAAVLGSAGPGSFDVVDLEEVAQLDPVRFRRALDSLGTSGVLRRRDDVVSFVAGAQRSLAFRELPPSTRLSLHARAAKLLRQSRVGPAALEGVDHDRSASRSARRRPVIAIAAAGVALVALWSWYGAGRSAATVSAGTHVLLADVENLTGDPAFGRTLYLAASVGLQQSRQISLFPRSRVRETLALMQRPGADSLLDETLAREVALRENLQRLVLLGIARAESAFVVTARIVHPASGRDLFADQERVVRAADVLEGVDRLLTRVRRASGEPVDSLRAYSVPLPRVTTASLAALQSYAAATNAWTARRFGEAQAGFTRAVELDSSFALAWLGLAEVSYQLATDRPAAFAALAQALRYADRLTEREQLRLQRANAGFRGLANDELRIAEQLARRFPERDTWYSVGTLLMRMRRCPDAIHALERSLTFDSLFAGAHLNVATCHQFLGQSDSAIAAYGRAYAVDSASVYSGGLNHEYGVALTRAGLIDSARRVYVRMAGRTQSFDRQFGQRSLAYLSAWVGQAREADAHFDSAAAFAVETRTPLSEFRNRILQSETRLTMGARDRAIEALNAATQLASRIPSLDPTFAMYAGLAHVRAGQVRRASALRDGMAGVPGTSSGDRTAHAVLSAHIALARGDARTARTLLAAATDTTRSDYVLPALVHVFMALGHTDSAFEASTRFAQRATFGTDAQDGWLRNLLTMGQLAERLDRLEAARAAYTRLEKQLSAGDPDHALRIGAREGLARLSQRDAMRALPVTPPPP